MKYSKFIGLLMCLLLAQNCLVARKRAKITADLEKLEKIRDEVLGVKRELAEEEKGEKVLSEKAKSLIKAAHNYHKAVLEDRDASKELQKLRSLYDAENTEAREYLETFEKEVVEAREFKDMSDDDVAKFSQGILTAGGFVARSPLFFLLWS
ncbi:hypothetical protein ACFLY6_01530, partial [Candidatus Dependentiae bacterium]